MREAWLQQLETAAKSAETVYDFLCKGLAKGVKPQQTHCLGAQILNRGACSGGVAVAASAAAVGWKDRSSSSCFVATRRSNMPCLSRRSEDCRPMLLYRKPTLFEGSLLRLARTSACSGVSGTAGSRLGGRPRGLAAAPAVATKPAPPSAAVPPSAAGAGTLGGRPPLLTGSELEFSQSSRRRLLMPSQHAKMARMSACCFQSPLLPGSMAVQSIFPPPSNIQVLRVA